MPPPRPIVVRRAAPPAAAHHGGAWKVAYADFVTAMMAFFLLLWLLNATSEQERSGIADYFSPTLSVAPGQSGGTGVLAGRAPKDVSTEGGIGASAILPTPMPPDPPPPAEAPADSAPEPTKPVDDDAGGAADIAREAKDIADELMADPALDGLAGHVAVEATPEGARIQIMDSERAAMFASGSDRPTAEAVAILARVAAILADRPERIVVTGHTDAAPLKGASGRSNWELSSERANAARRTLEAAGIPATRFAEMSGAGATEPLYPDRPRAAENRRVTVFLRREPAAAPPRGIAARPPGF